MSRSGYEIFKTKSFTLAKTIIVKHEESAQIMNNYLRRVEGYYVDEQNRWTWRYYLNMAGEYHEADHRELAEINGNGVGMMTIRIADTNGSREVNFTKDLLHGPTADYALANEYTYDSRAYKDLLERYPNFESLILGILNPIDIDTAVLSPNHSVLYCGDYFAKPYNSNYSDLIYELSDNVMSGTGILIEPQENNLIYEIQQYISNTIFRWNTSEYISVDNLYWATLLGNMYAYLPNIIMNIRLANCHTDKVHTFHITEFLESNGQLGRHVQNIPLPVAMYLYRNVRYYNQNYGKDSTFQAMVDNLLTPMRVPLSGFDAVHDTVAMPENLYPTPYMLRDPINLAQVGSGRDLRTVEYVMTKEVPLAKSNGRDLEERIEETTDVLKQTKYNDLRSKVLESTMMDFTDSERYTLPDLLFNMWIWSATHDRYRGTIYVTHPYSGERIQLTPINALTLFFYCVQRAVYEIPVESPPILVPRWIPKKITDIDYPTLKSLQYITVKKYVSDSELRSMMSNHDPLMDYGSTRIFHDAGVRIWEELMRRQRILYRTEDLNGRAMLEASMREFYQFDIECQMLPDGVTYENWLRGLGIDFTHLSNDDLITLAMSIYIKATGQDINTRTSVADMQQSLLDIMKHFSSYTVQYLKGITFGSPVNTDGKLIRLSDKSFNRGFGGKLGGYLELPKLNGELLYYPRFGEWLPLQHRDPLHDPLLNNSGWVTRFGGSIGLSGVNTVQLQTLRIKSAASIPHFNVSNFDLWLKEGAPTTFNYSSKPYPVLFMEGVGGGLEGPDAVIRANPFVNVSDTVSVNFNADVTSPIRRFPLVTMDYGNSGIVNSNDLDGDHRISALDLGFDVDNVICRFPLVVYEGAHVEAINTSFDVGNVLARNVLIKTDLPISSVNLDIDVASPVRRSLSKETTMAPESIDFNIDVGNVIGEGTLTPPYDLEGEYNP